jgi:hypothetical protein
MAPPLSTEPSSEGERPSFLGRIPWLRLAAEFGVIFLGITLSLLADDWRQSRSEVETERRALEELLSDLVADDSVLTGLERQSESHNLAMMWLYQRRGDARVDPDSVNAGLGATSAFDPPHLLRATYAGLLSTGQLRVIRSDALRREIVTYYENVLPEVSRFHDIYYDVWYSFRELVGPDYVWLYEEDAEGFGSGALLGGRLERAWSEISTDPTLVFRLREAGVVASVVSRLASRALAENAKLRTAIRSHLET